jgi:hypothetical protein
METGSLALEQDLKHTRDHAIVAATGVRVVVLSRVWDIVVLIDHDASQKDLRWEGRGDRLLLFWKSRCFLERNSGEEIRHDCLSSAFARAISLPCDMDFSRAVPSRNGSQFVLRVPKQGREFASKAGPPTACYHQGNWGAGV